MTDRVTPQAQPQAAYAAIEAVWRLESARIIASLARLVLDVALAEDLAQDALVAALQEWPKAGIPNNPGGWLMLAAKHRAIDRLRRNDRLDDKLAQLGHQLRDQQLAAIAGGLAEFDAVIDDDGLSDDLLRLIFVACLRCCPPTPASRSPSGCWAG